MLRGSDMVEKGYNKFRSCEEYKIEREGGNRDEFRGRREGGGGQDSCIFSLGLYPTAVI